MTILRTGIELHESIMWHFLPWGNIEKTEEKYFFLGGGGGGGGLLALYTEWGQILLHFDITLAA